MELDTLADSMEEVFYVNGETVARKEEKPEHVYFVLEGDLRVLKNADEDQSREGEAKAAVRTFVFSFSSSS